VNDVTLSELQTSIKDQADMENSSFIDDTQLTYWINVAIAELHDLLVASFAEYFVKKIEFSLVANQEQYLLPSDFFKAIKLFYREGDNRFQLKRFMMEELGRYSDEVINSVINNQYLRYRIIGGLIYFAPLPNAAGTVELWYVPHATKLVDSGDKIHYSVPVGWEDYIVTSCVIRCLAKEESDVSFWMQRKAFLIQHIQDMASDRDEGESERVTDVYNRFSEYEESFD
jgi:hypothetical protein